MGPTAPTDPRPAPHVDDKRHPTPNRLRRDGGYSLVEILVSIALMAIVISSVLPSLISAIRLSRFSDTQARVEAVLGSAVDRVSNFGWLPCPATDAEGGYAAKAKIGAQTVDWPDSTVEVLSIKYWDVGSKSWSNVNPVSSANECDKTAIATTKERTLQLVRIRVTSPDGTVSSQLDVVIGDIRTDEERDVPNV